MAVMARKSFKPADYVESDLSPVRLLELLRVRGCGNCGGMFVLYENVVVFKDGDGEDG